jgi:hypothetical protein
MASKSSRAEHGRNAGRSRDKFAAKLATIVLRWRTVYMQEPHAADPGLWMSTRAAKPSTRSPS